MIQQGSGLKLDVNNNYNIQQKRLVNVGEGIDNDDAITKHQMEVGLSTKPDKTYVDGRKKIQSLIHENNIYYYYLSGTMIKKITFIFSSDFERCLRNTPHAKF